MTQQEPSAITLLDRRIACANRVWTVYADHIRDQHGVEVVDYLTIAPKRPRSDLLSGVTILPVIGDCFGLLRSYRHAVAGSVWELPRGFIDAGEEPAAAALRELREETGLLCEPHQLLPLGTFMPECSTIAGRGALFAALDCRVGGRVAADEVGLGQMHLLPRRRITEMLTNFEIEDASSLVLLYRYMAQTA